MNIVFIRSSKIYDESRSTKEIIAFLENGYHVAVLGWDRDGSALNHCKKLFRKYGSRISFNFYSGVIGENTFQKIVSRGRWYRWIKRELALQSHIDIIHACDYDTGSAVRRFAKKQHIKYVYDIYDYYVDTHPVPRFLRRIVEHDEIRTINEASLTIICTEERKEQIKKARPKKMIVIHNSPEVAEYKICKEEYDYAYCGCLNDGRLVKEILEMYSAFSLYKFIFAGTGEYAEVARKLVNNYSSFSFLGPVPYLKVLEIERRSKVISAIYEPSIRNHQLCAPNKFYEALALGKPLIVCRGTGIDKIVENNNIGIVINYNAEEFFKALQQLCANDSLRLVMGQRARSLYEQKYKWSFMKKRLLDAYEEL